jgi:hypothetical protein
MGTYEPLAVGPTYIVHKKYEYSLKNSLYAPLRGCSSDTKVEMVIYIGCISPERGWYAPGMLPLMRAYFQAHHPIFELLRMKRPASRG